MDDRFVALAAAAANQHGVFTTTMARALGVSDRLRHEWLELGWIEALGPHTFRFAGAPTTWKMSLAAALGNLGPEARISGRSAAALHHLDGFEPGPAEIWVPGHVATERPQGFGRVPGRCDPATQQRSMASVASRRSA
jgi:hypothetical protein